MNDLSPIAVESPATLRELIDLNPVVGAPKAGPKRFWTHPELRILREHYPHAGAAGCVALLPGRTAHAIYCQALKFKLERLTEAGTARRPRTRWTWTTQQDEAIARVYSGKPKRGAVKALARTLGRPLSAIARRALERGLSLPRFKELDWSEPELEILRRMAPRSGPVSIVRALAAAGYKRTAAAVKVKARRLSIEREIDDNAFTARGLAIALGIDRKRVGVFVDRGWLKARKVRMSEGTVEDGNWRILRKDVRNFIIDNVAIVDFAKVDKFWLVDLLTETSSRDRRGGQGE